MEEKEDEIAHLRQALSESQAAHQSCVGRIRELELQCAQLSKDLSKRKTLHRQLAGHLKDIVEELATSRARILDCDYLVDLLEGDLGTADSSEGRMYASLEEYLDDMGISELISLVCSHLEVTEEELLEVLEENARLEQEIHILQHQSSSPLTTEPEIQTEMHAETQLTPRGQTEARCEDGIGDVDGGSGVIEDKRDSTTEHVEHGMTGIEDGDVAPENHDEDDEDDDEEEEEEEEEEDSDYDDDKEEEEEDEDLFGDEMTVVNPMMGKSAPIAMKKPTVFAQPSSITGRSPLMGKSPLAKSSPSLLLPHRPASPATSHINFPTTRDMRPMDCAVAWIASILKDPSIEVPVKDFYNTLGSGIHLCETVNAIQKNSVPRIFSLDHPFHQIANIDAFLKACSSIGVPQSDLFVSADLLEKKNFDHVVHTIYSLARVARAKGYCVPPLGPRLARRYSRHFTMEQIRQARNAIPLLMLSSSKQTAPGESLGLQYQVIKTREEHAKK